MGVRSWLGRLFNRGKVDPQPAATRWNFGRLVAGVNVTCDSALQNAAVWACVNYLSRTVAQLPWRVMQDTGRGSVVVSTNPADYLIYQRPNPDMGSFSWRQSMLGTALIWGNAFSEIQRDNRGAPYALWPIHPERVIVRRGNAGELEYDVWNNTAGKVTLAASDVFHVRGFGDGPIGYSVIDYAAQSIGWAQAAEIFGAAFFGEGMNPSGLVEVPPTTKMSLPGREILRQELDRLYKGPSGKRTVILDAGMKFQKLSTNPNDSQFIETMQYQVEMICRWFGVPPHKVMHLLRATFSNIEHQSIEVVVDSITPWVKIFEEEANYKLFGANRSGLFTKMNLRGLLRGDNASRADYYSKLFGVGALSINDILGLEDMNGIGADGDTRFVSQNVQTLTNAINGVPVGTADNPVNLPAIPKNLLNSHGHAVN
jgi:HK97 family phage portal protein